MNIKKLNVCIILLTAIFSGTSISNDSTGLINGIQNRYQELKLDLRISRVEPIYGQGVSSDIYFVDTCNGLRHVLKYPRENFKTAKKEKVPLTRTVSEVKYLKFARGICPENFPKVIAHDSKGFLMEYFPSEEYPVLREELKRGHISPDFYAKLGSILGQIHRKSCENKNRMFDDFNAIDVLNNLRWKRFYEPLKSLSTVADMYISDLEKRFFDYHQRNVLCHSDLASKNILFNAKNPILLDAEMAVFAPPELDIGFISVDLLFAPNNRVTMPKVELCIKTFIESYRKEFVTSTQGNIADNIETHVGYFLPAMILSRLHGMSTIPLENAQQEENVTASMLSLIRTGGKNISIDAVLSAWKKAMPVSEKRVPEAQVSPNGNSYAQTNK